MSKFRVWVLRFLQVWLNINSHFKDSKFTLDAGLVDENFTFIHTYHNNILITHKLNKIFILGMIKVCVYI